MVMLDVHMLVGLWMMCGALGAPGTNPCSGQMDVQLDGSWIVLVSSWMELLVLFHGLVDS